MQEYLIAVSRSVGYLGGSNMPAQAKENIAKLVSE